MIHKINVSPIQTLIERKFKERRQLELKAFKYKENCSEAEWSSGSKAINLYTAMDLNLKAEGHVHKSILASPTVWFIRNSEKKISKNFQKKSQNYVIILFL